MSNDIFARAAYLERQRRAEDEYRGLAHRAFLRVPDCFKQIDRSRQVAAVISDETIDDYGRSFSPAGCDAERYLALSRAIFYGHNPDLGGVAWCVTLDVRSDAVLPSRNSRRPARTKFLISFGIEFVRARRGARRSARPATPTLPPS